MTRSPAVWVEAARPKTLGAGVAPVIIGTAMAYEAGVFHVLTAVCTFVCVVLIQIGTNFANDYFDFVKGADTEARVGPTRATQAGLISPRGMLIATVVVLGLAFVCGLYLVIRGGWPILAIGLLSLALAVLYTGGPYPLAYVGLGDMFVLVFFGPVAVAGTYYVQTLRFDWLPVIAGMAPGLFSMAILTVNNLRDADGDVHAGKRTLAVRFGKGFARAEYIGCLALATLAVPIAAVAMSNGHYLALAACGAAFPAFVMARRVTHPCIEPAGLNPYLGATGQLLLAYSVMFAVGWIL